MAQQNNRNYGTVEPEYYQENLGPLTVKGQKYALVNGLKQKLNAAQDKLNELKKYQESLIKKGKDLDEEDMKSMKRLENIIANLKGIIDNEVTRFNLKIK